MNLAVYSKAIAAAIPSLVLVLNQILPVTSGNTKLYVNAALAVLAVLAVYLAPANVPAVPAPPSNLPPAR